MIAHSETIFVGVGGLNEVMNVCICPNWHLKLVSKRSGLQKIPLVVGDTSGLLHTRCSTLAHFERETTQSKSISTY